MRHQMLSYSPERGWDQPLPVALDSPQTLVLALAGSGLSATPEPFAALASTFTQAVLLGCSTAGEISGGQVHDNSVSVAVVQFEHTQLQRAFTTVANAADSFDAGVRLAAQLVRDDLAAVFILSDGLCVNGTPLVEGLTRGLPAGVSITGGLAGDGSRFAHTWVLDGDTPRANCICAVGFYGKRLQVGHGCEGGWSDFGPERRITRAKGNVLYELDDKPALELYKTYLGERAAGLPGTALLFPLSVRRDTDGLALVRTILGVDESHNSLTFAGDVPVGGIARLMRANTDMLIGKAGVAARLAMQGLQPSDTSLIISVSCVGRRLVLGERTEEEIETVLEGTSGRAAHVGFYSYGEISPSVSGRSSELHNQTMTVTVLSEA